MRVRREGRDWLSRMVWMGPQRGQQRLFAPATSIIANVRRRGDRAAPRVVRVWRRWSFTEPDWKW